MVTEVSLGLLDRGVATVVPDLYGTGDSGGDFADADWVTWRDDLARASTWARGEGAVVTAILAIRLGCGLAAAAVLDGCLPSVARTVLWQPMFDGERFVGQFLRLRTAAGLMDHRKESVTDLRSRLDAGETLEVAGYALSGRLAADIAGLKPPPALPPALGRITWMEIVRRPEATLPMPSTQFIERARGNGSDIEAMSFGGEPFWTSTEIVVNSDMVAATIARLSTEALDIRGTAREFG